jgi:hypothetical protein
LAEGGDHFGFGLDGLAVDRGRLKALGLHDAEGHPIQVVIIAADHSTGEYVLAANTEIGAEIFVFSPVGIRSIDSPIGSRSRKQGRPGFEGYSPLFRYHRLLGS